MIKSMTGYGQSTKENNNCQITVEIKSLNSKFLDCSLKLPRAFSDKELEIRNLINDSLERGKVSISIDYQTKDAESGKAAINESLFLSYYQQYAELCKKVSAPETDLFKLALHSPEVLSQKDTSEEALQDWPLVFEAIKEAISACDKFRQQEGDTLKGKFLGYIKIIEDLLNEVIAQDPIRMENIRKRINNNLEEIIGKDKIDQNRFEQELIFYTEKLDISEEKVRLKTHLDYFIEVLQKEKSAGKKLGFIGQEIGREINTIGSKANDATIQKKVVVMKDELEKIKEQLMNLI